MWVGNLRTDLPPMRPEKIEFKGFVLIFTEEIGLFLEKWSEGGTEHRQFPQVM